MSQLTDNRVNISDDKKLEKTKQADRRLFELNNATVRNSTSNESPYPISKAHKKRSLRLLLLGHAQNLLIDSDVLSNTKNKHRTRFCNMQRIYSADNAVIRLNQNESASSANMGHVALCGSVWACPYCAVSVARKRGDEIGKAIKWATDNRLVPVMVTLTASHSVDWSLGYFKDKFKNAWQLFKKGKAWQGIIKKWGIKHYIRTTEVLRSRSFGWHYHYHILLFVDAHLLMQDNYASEMQESLLTRWLNCLERAELWGNEHALHVSAHDNIKADYLSKLGLKADDIGRLDLEMTNIASKQGKGITVWELLKSSFSHGNAVAGGLYVEYVEAMSDEDFVYWSAHLKELCGVKQVPDELLVTEESEELDDIHEDWLDVSDGDMYAIKRTKCLPYVLDISAGYRDRDKTRAFIDRMHQKITLMNCPTDEMKAVYKLLSSARANFNMARRSYRSTEDKKIKAMNKHYMTLYKHDIRHFENQIYLLEEKLIGARDW